MNLDAKISFYNNAKDVAPSKEITIRDLVRIIHDEEHAAAVALVRSAQTDDEKKVAKMKLPAVQISGHVIEGNRAQAIQQGRFTHSGWLQLDIDGDGLNGNTPQRARAILGADRHVLSAFVTPSGQGAKALFRVKPCLTDQEHKRSFGAVQKYIRDAYGLSLDPSTKDTGRLCYLSADKECTWNGAPVEFVLPVEKSPEPTKSKSIKPGGVVIRGNQEHDSTLADLAEMLAPIQRPSYDQWLRICSGAWNHFGESATTVLAARWPEESPGEYADKFSHRLVDVTLGTVVHLAKEHGWTPRSRSSGTPAGNTPPPPPKDVFRVMLAERAFNAANVPPKPVPVLSLGDKCIGTPGNLMALQAGIKVGKSGVVGAINAAFFIGNYANQHDTLGFSADNPDGHAVIHFDTEQSRYDHDGTIRRALSRVDMEAPPTWFQSFSVADLPTGNRVMAMETALEDAVESFGGIRCIILDGVADFMRDPNDPTEAFALVDKLHADAIKHNCTIIVVIHENPGSDIGKTRGHLGSQLARKSESNLRLQKDVQTGITTIWADAARHCHIPKNEGTCFSWCDTLGRHVSRGSAGTIKASQKTEKFRTEAESAFGDAASLAYSALVAGIMAATGLKSEKTAEKRIVTYQAEGIVSKTSSGSYSLK